VIARHLDQLEVVGGDVGHVLGVGGLVSYEPPTATTGTRLRVGAGHGRIVKVGDDAVALPVLDAGQAQAEVFFRNRSQVARVELRYAATPAMTSRSNILFALNSSAIRCDFICISTTRSETVAILELLQAMPGRYENFADP
jgi:hypothetical protein